MGAWIAAWEQKIPFDRKIYFVVGLLFLGLLPVAIVSAYSIR